MNEKQIREWLVKLQFRQVQSDGLEKDWKGETWYRDNINCIYHFDKRDGYPFNCLGRHLFLEELVEWIIESTIDEFSDCY